MLFILFILQLNAVWQNCSQSPTTLLWGWACPTPWSWWWSWRCPPWPGPPPPPRQPPCPAWPCPRPSAWGSWPWPPPGPRRRPAPCPWSSGCQRCTSAGGTSGSWAGRSWHRRRVRIPCHYTHSMLPQSSPGTMITGHQGRVIPLLQHLEIQKIHTVSFS